MQYDYSDKPVNRMPKPAHWKMPIQVAIEMDCCAQCGGEAEIFTDDLSAKEYPISGLCQTCQNRFFDDGE